jgi:8-amino-7-oxononanoate synthase
MAGNDYLGLCRHPAMVGAAQKALLQKGAGSGASRLAAGTLDSHQELEKKIAEFKHAEAALFFSTGYMTNLAAVSGLAGPDDLVVSDSLNHASIIDACRLSRAKIKVYPHNKPKEAARILAAEKTSGLKILVTDSVFSMDGDLALLPDLWDAARENGALMVVDDAHGTGVWGGTGRGVLEFFRLAPQPGLIQVGTFSKALGGLGGFVAGDQVVIESLIQGARSFLYTTAPPPAQTAVANKALDLVDEEPWRRDKLHNLARRLRQGLGDNGFMVKSKSGPILPVMVGEAPKAVAMANCLLKHGLYAPAMRPPTVPWGKSRIRVTVSAAHSEEDVDFAITAFVKVRQELGS